MLEESFCAQGKVIHVYTRQIVTPDLFVERTYISRQLISCEFSRRKKNNVIASVLFVIQFFDRKKNHIKAKQFIEILILKFALICFLQLQMSFIR